MNWNYIAGFFDGEGSVAHNGMGFRISIPQTNEEVLNEIRNFTKIGFVIPVKKRKSHWKDSWVYYIASKKDVYYFLNQAVPYLIVKKDLTLEAMSLLKKQLLRMQDKKKTHDKRKIEGITIDQIRECIKRGSKYKQTDGLKAVYGYINVAYKSRGNKCIIKSVFVNK